MRKTWFAFCLCILFLLSLSGTAQGEVYYINGEGDLAALDTVMIEPETTLYTLAEAYQTTVRALLDWNDVDPCRLQVGSSLYLPPADLAAPAAWRSAGSPEYAPEFTLTDRLFTFAWPVSGVITSPFGQRTRNYHYGLDIAADAGTEIHAAAAGRVVEADWKNDAYGWAVMIGHGSGIETLYGHCEALLVEEGQWVEAGETVARMGSTGNSTGPHVHFEVRFAGQCADPEAYLPQTAE